MHQNVTSKHIKLSIFWQRYQHSYSKICQKWANSVEFPVIDIFQKRFCLLFISHDRPPKCHNWSFTWFTSFAQFQELIYSQLLKIHFGGLWLIYDDIFLFDLSIRPFVLLRNVFLNLCMWYEKLEIGKCSHLPHIVFVNPLRTLNHFQMQSITAKQILKSTDYW